jgi:glycosyltransferase involved in cell wall biosynthesis/sterol desaturase/sphingolipid hydroxylase (fatty acid hydroxylase superfamily)
LQEEAIKNQAELTHTDQLPQQRVWGTMLLGVLGLTVVLIWVAARAQDGGASGWNLSSPFASLVEAYCPAGLQSLAQKAAQVYLSPWLYLLMAGVFLAEKLIPADREQPVFSVGMIQDCLGWFVLGAMMRVALLGVFVSGLYWYCERYLAGLRIEAVALWPTVLVVVLAILAGDLLNWFHHFIRHKIGVLWLFHTIHHSQKQMNMFTDLRVHLVEYVVAKPITIFPLFVLGLNIELAFWLTLVLEAYSRIYHGNLRTNYGPLRYIMVTPQSHRIHHSIEPEHADKNFGVLFSFWDRLFGTQWTGYDDYPETGIDDARFPHEQSVGGVRIITNYLNQLLYPFIMIGKRAMDRPAQTHDTVSAYEPNSEPGSVTKIALDIRFRVPSGSSVALQNLAIRLVRQAPEGLQFVVVRYQHQVLPPELNALEAIYVPKMPAGLELIWNELRLPGLLARTPVDLYHGMKQCAPVRLKCPSVHTVDAIKRGSADDLPLPLMHRMYWGWHVCSIYRRSDHLLPVSEYVGKFLTKELGVDQDRMTVVHNGVGDAFLQSNRDSDAKTDDLLGLDGPYIICVGTVIPLKNQLAAVMALGKIKDRVPHHLVLLGREDPAYAQQIREAAERVGVADRLHFTGFMDADVLIRHMLNATSMVHPSRTEGFGLVAGEAMACGLPLVVSDRGGLKEVCGDVAVYFDDPDDYDALAEAMLRVLTDSELRETMRHGGLSRAASLSWPEAARMTLGVYQRLLSA